MMFEHSPNLIVDITHNKEIDLLPKPEIWIHFTHFVKFQDLLSANL